MSRNKGALAGFLVLVLLCAGQALHYAPLLPERIASHFGPGGAPTAWMSRELFIRLNLLVVGLTAALFLAVASAVGALPVSWINLPNKAYWMAPERRRETVDAMAAYFLWHGTATLLLLLDVFRQVYRFNLSLSRELEHPVASLAIYLVVVSAWSAGFIRRFSRK